MKPLNWVGSSKKDYTAFPEDVQDTMGYALFRAQEGKCPSTAKPMKGFVGASVLEIVEEHQGDAYRAVYTVRFSKVVYVLHAFQKKSKKGVATSKADIDLIKSRLRMAEADHRLRMQEKAP